MDINIIRSNRKSLKLEVRAEGVTVRAPWYAGDGEIERFVRKHQAWIEEKLEQMPPAADILTAEEIRALADKALEIIPERVRYFAGQMGLTYGRITIRNQRTRWGSCSGKGNLNFNCLLMLTPPEVIDSVVVHELCHLKEMNQSDRFYAEVLKVFPEYRKWDAWLKKNGAAIMRRMG